LKDSVVFAHLIEEYGSHDKPEHHVARRNIRKGTLGPIHLDHPDKVKLIQAEERVTGSVTWLTYTKYFRFAGSILWVPAIIILVLFSQAASGKFILYHVLITTLTVSAVGNSIFLGFWTSASIRGFSQGNYMAVYAALGAAQAGFAFLLSYALA